MLVVVVAMVIIMAINLPLSWDCLGKGAKSHDPLSDHAEGMTEVIGATSFNLMVEPRCLPFRAPHRMARVGVIDLY